MNESGRESIWSVPREAKPVYFIAFGALFLSGLAVLVYRSTGQAGGWLDKVVDVWNDAGPLAIASAALAMIMAEVLGGVMVLAKGLNDRLEKAREARRQEGRQEGRQEEWKQTLEIVREVRKEFPDDPAMEEIERRLRDAQP